MKRTLAVEPVAPMSAVNVECDIIGECNNKILTKNWKGQYMQLAPSCVKDEKTIYRVEDVSYDMNALKAGWIIEEGEVKCLVNSKKTNKNMKKKKK
jgi:hypothetical protein